MDTTDPSGKVQQRWEFSPLLFIPHIYACAQQGEEDDENGVVEEDQVLMVISQNDFHDLLTSHNKDNSQLVSHLTSCILIVMFCCLVDKCFSFLRFPLVR